MTTKNILILLLLIKVCSGEFSSNWCFSSNNNRCNSSYPEMIELICKTFKNFNSKQNCTVEFDRFKVKSVKYECKRNVSFISLDPQVLKTLPNVHDVDISGLGLHDFEVLLHKNVISGKIETPNLNIAKLNASNNVITRIRNSTLAQMPNITEIDFSFNKFNSLICADFEGAFRLISMNFSNNNISFLASDILSKQKNLEILDLSNNKITKLDRSLLMNNIKMKVFNMQFNPLTHFNFNIFSPNVKSITVHLPSRSMVTLDVSCRRGNCLFKRFDDSDYFENLRSFNGSGLGYGVGTGLEYSLSSGMKTNLEPKLGSGNQHGNISGLFEKFGRNLRTLDLSRNWLNKNDINMLKNFTNLEQLKINHANLSRIQFETLANLPKLRSLDLSYNALNTVDPMIFENLETLNLEGNQFHNLDAVIPEFFPKLTSLAISRNYFDCDYLEKFLRKWENIGNFEFVSNPGAFQINIKGVDCYNDSPNEDKRPENSDTFAFTTIYLIVIVICFAVLLCVLTVLIIFQAFRMRKFSNIEINAESMGGSTGTGWNSSPSGPIVNDGIGQNQINQNVINQRRIIQNGVIEDRMNEDRIIDDPTIHNRVIDMRFVRSESTGYSEPDYDEIDTQSTIFEQNQREVPIFMNRSLPTPPIYDQHHYGRVRNSPPPTTSLVNPYAYSRVFKRTIL